jgi:hypothetical protein
VTNLYIRDRFRSYNTTNIQVGISLVLITGGKKLTNNTDKKERQTMITRKFSQNTQIGQKVQHI